jgi:hypothetical protein
VLKFIQRFNFVDWGLVRCFCWVGRVASRRVRAPRVGMGLYLGSLRGRRVPAISLASDEVERDGRRRSMRGCLASSTPTYRALLHVSR